MNKKETLREYVERKGKMVGHGDSETNALDWNEPDVVQPFDEGYLMFLESRCRAIASTDIDKNWQRAYLRIADASTIALSMQRRYLK